MTEKISVVQETKGNFDKEPFFYYYYLTIN